MAADETGLPFDGNGGLEGCDIVVHPAPMAPTHTNGRAFLIRKRYTILTLLLEKVGRRI
jgi:hypothetical protein